MIAGYHAVVDPSALDRGFQVLVYTTLMLRNRETIAAFEAAWSSSTRSSSATGCSATRTT